jgi:hypothetical protein
MHAIHAPAARTDMAKQGRKYGNLNIHVVERLSYGLGGVKILMSGKWLRGYLLSKYRFLRENTGVLLCRLKQD